MATPSAHFGVAIDYFVVIRRVADGGASPGTARVMANVSR